MDITSIAEYMAKLAGEAVAVDSFTKFAAHLHAKLTTEIDSDRDEWIAAMAVLTNGYLADSKKSILEIPAGQLFRYMELGSVTPEEMRGAWAAMLAHVALGPRDVPPFYPFILSQLQPADVWILNHLYNVVDFATWPAESQEPSASFILERVPLEAVPRTVMNLQHHGLAMGGRFYDEPLTEQRVRELNVGITWLGKDFVEKCRPPIRHRR